jgi:hypothetical protein
LLLWAERAAGGDVPQPIRKLVEGQCQDDGLLEEFFDL